GLHGKLRLENLLSGGGGGPASTLTALQKLHWVCPAPEWGNAPRPICRLRAAIFIDAPRSHEAPCRISSDAPPSGLALGSQRFGAVAPERFPSCASLP